MSRIPLPAALVALLLFAPGASAAVIEHVGIGGSEEDVVIYVADKGERNRVTVVATKNRITITDRGATIRRKRYSLKGCRVVSRHRAVCRLAGDTGKFVDLGDRSDTLRFKARKGGGRLGETSRSDVGNPEDLADDYRVDQGDLGHYAIIDGGRGNDVLNGSRYDDLIRPGPGRNRSDGGAGSDRIVVQPGGGGDRARGGLGLDTVDVETSQAVTIDLAAQTITAGTATDRLNSVERVHGGDGDDRISGTTESDGLFGDGGADQIDGLGDADFIGGDLGTTGARPNPGVDTLTGGPGGDIVDGRDGARETGTPTDQLLCGDDTDSIIARGDDLADPSCERSMFGVFTGAPQHDQFFFPAFSGVQPTARGADGAPAYLIACPNDDGRQENARCTGRVELRRPPAAGTFTFSGELLGSGEFSIKPMDEQNVAVALNDAGKAALGQPETIVSVNVVAAGSSHADFGWQQRLTR